MRFNKSTTTLQILCYDFERHLLFILHADRVVHGMCCGIDGADHIAAEFNHCFQ